MINMKRLADRDFWRIVSGVVLTGILFAGPVNLRAEIILQDDFSNGNKNDSSNFNWTDNSNNVYVKNDPVTGKSTIPYSDSYSLAFTHRAKPDGSDSTAEQRFRLGKNYPELWFSYYIRVPDNYYNRTQTSSDNSKFLALWSDTYEGNGITVVLEYWPTGDGGSKLAWRQVLNSTRKQHKDHTRIITVPGDRGKWMHFVYHVKMASKVGVNDGVVQTWLKKEGESSYRQIHNVTNANISASGATPGFNTGYFFGWSNAGFDEETSFYIDDVVISTTPLLGAAPNPPSIIP